MARYGMTVPLDGIPLHEQRDWFREMVDLGYTDFWSSEAGGYDGFTPLALASAWTPTARLGIAIIPAYTRGPGLLAMSVGSLAAAAPGRFVMGIGTSSDVIVERWNGLPFEKPYQRVRDSVRFLRKALAGEKVDETYETFRVRGFKLGFALPAPPPILVAALRPGMLRLAGREGDGAILNWLSAADVRTVAPHVHQGGPNKEIVCRIFVCATADKALARNIGRRAIAAYLNVPVYAAFHEWLGRGPRLKGMWDAWKAGDRKAALEAIPDDVVDELILHGSPAEIREHVQRYVANGVHTPALAVIFGGPDLRQTIRDLSPSAK
jgi:probable F420-dependent oxidoreductase